MTLIASLIEVLRCSSAAPGGRGGREEERWEELPLAAAPISDVNPGKAPGTAENEHCQKGREVNSSPLAFLT